MTVFTLRSEVTTLTMSCFAVGLVFARQGSPDSGLLRRFDVHNGDLSIPFERT
jgi:hypothetical protein